MVLEVKPIFTQCSAIPMGMQERKVASFWWWVLKISDSPFLSVALFLAFLDYISIQYFCSQICAIFLGTMMNDANKNYEIILGANCLSRSVTEKHRSIDDGNSLPGELL